MEWQFSVKLFILVRMAPVHYILTQTFWDFGIKIKLTRPIFSDNPCWIFTCNVCSIRKNISENLSSIKMWVILYYCYFKFKLRYLKKIWNCFQYFWAYIVLKKKKKRKEKKRKEKKRKEKKRKEKKRKEKKRKEKKRKEKKRKEKKRKEKKRKEKKRKEKEKEEKKRRVFALFF